MRNLRGQKARISGYSGLFQANFEGGREVRIKKVEGRIGNFTAKTRRRGGSGGRATVPPCAALCRLGKCGCVSEWVGARPHPGLMASQARHQSGAQMGRALRASWFPKEKEKRFLRWLRGWRHHFFGAQGTARPTGLRWGAGAGNLHGECVCSTAICCANC